MEEAYRADEAEHAYEIQNRIRNLLWTVSGDYAAETEPDIALFRRSKYRALYDAVRQGAFARYYDTELFGNYVVRKIYLGADAGTLLHFACLAMDSAVINRILTERPGVPNFRRRAFEDTLDQDFSRLTGSPGGRLEAAYLWHALTGMLPDARTRPLLFELLSLREGAETMDVIAVSDKIYNAFCDPEGVFPDLSEVMAVSEQKLREYDWQDYLDEEALESGGEDLLRQLQSRMQEEERERREGRRTVVIDEEAAAKMQQYIELNYGKSYLPGREQARLTAQICRGAHADSCLHFTDGILENMVRVNSQSEYARRTKEVNLRVLNQNRHVAHTNIRKLSDVLKRALVSRSEREICTSDHGTVRIDRLWNVGRTSNRQLFVREIRREQTDFAVEVLIDASGSQRARQSGVALQAYMISESLSAARIPHRVMGFCTFWDYTVLRRFRDYDEGPEANMRIFEFYGSANNRDGLAIRAAAQSLREREEEHKILIVLSDGRPNDLIVNRPHSRNPMPYCGEYAVKDTAGEVRKLRNSGIAVLGVFTGTEQDLQAEKRIYGKDFAYIRDISAFSNVVGRYLKKQLLD